ncbi:DUF6612 family protein [Paenibacillus glucanolyticus]|uniref:DUF6612 family protein n=1 Tax=Paenibacillus glucanolyticus TaxID=59843 RepID=UPI00128CA656|nr:DUF6612 family protein [Paenibacillus glucanolyticus]MPY19970.1 hypothetical protein [Paenibacillus glucanolyticus]
MKKWTAVLLGAILMMSIAACGNDSKAGDDAAAPPTTGQETTTPAETPPVAEEPQEEAAPTAEELLQKSAEASQNLKSFAMKADIKQHIVIEGAEKQEQNVDMSLDSEITLEPMEMMQNIAMDSPDGKVEMKQYITEDGIYMHMDGQWMQVPAESEKEIRDSLDMANASPEQQLEQFKAIAKDFTVTEEGDVYVLTADVSGDNLKELAKTMMNQAGNDPQMEAMMDQMDIKSISIVYGVQKETYLPATTDMDMVMEMAAEGDKVTLDMKMKSAYSKHDEISKIEVPKEALNAK